MGHPMNTFAQDVKSENGMESLVYSSHYKDKFELSNENKHHNLTACAQRIECKMKIILHIT